MKEVIIVGGGPAGLSAALYTVRAGHTTRIIKRDGGALMRADTVENYYGTEGPISGRELNARTEANARRLGVLFEDGEVTGIALTADGRFSVTTKSAVHLADGVILATGSERAMPKIEGAEEYFGKGVSSCAVCDSFAARKRDVIVIGAGEYALHEAEALLGVAAGITLCTNGEPAPEGSERFTIRTEPIEAIVGDTLVRGVRLAGGEIIPAAMVFLAIGIAGAGRLAATLGLMTEGGRITVDRDMRTAIPRLYAAGDCTGGFLQIATAVAEGAIAGARLSAELKK